MDEYGPDLPGDEAYVTRALEGKATEWVMRLHNDDTEELHHFDPCMMAIRQWLENPLPDLRARIRIRTIRQGRHSITAYIQEFQGMPRCLLDWPQVILIDYFREGLNCKVFYTCLS